MKRRQRRSAVWGIAGSIVMNGIAPYLLYIWLKDKLPGTQALLLATILPVVENAYYLIIKKKPDAFGLLMAGSFVLGAALALSGGDERLILLRESMVTAAVGACFLLSLLLRRPLIYYLAERFLAGSAAFEARWSNAYFRFVLRLMTAVWGVLLLAEAAVRTILALELSTEAFLAVSPLVFYGALAAAIGWTAGYRRYAMRKLRL